MQEEGGLPRYGAGELYFMAHADVAITVGMGDSATASAIAIAKSLV